MSANIRVLHAIPGAPAVDIYVNSVLTVRQLRYSQITNYVAVPNSRFTVSVRIAGTDTVLLTRSYGPLAVGKYTIVAAGADGASATLYTYNDDNLPAPTGFSNISFVNVAPGSPPSDMYINSALAFRNVSFGGSPNLTFYQVGLQGNNSVSVSVIGTFNRVPLFGPATIPAVSGSSQTLFMIGTTTNPSFPIIMVVANNLGDAPIPNQIPGGIPPGITGPQGNGFIPNGNNFPPSIPPSITGPQGNGFIPGGIPPGITVAQGNTLINRNTTLMGPRGPIDINRAAVFTGQQYGEGNTVGNRIVMEPLPATSGNSWNGYSPRGLQQNFDINRYMGTWYQAASIPQFFSAPCARSKAEYRLRRNGTVAVKNTCFNSNLEIVSTINGSAEVVDPRQPAALRVTFDGPIGGPNMIPPGPNYLVHKTDYVTYALVGSPNRDTLFFLSRSRRMCQSTYDKLIRLSNRLGYDTSKIKIDMNAIKRSC